MIEVKTREEVEKIISENFSTSKCEFEEIDTKNACGRIVFEDIQANENVPQFNRSTVDGFAVFSSDTFGASQSIPAMLNIAYEVFMGKEAEKSLKIGQCVKIPTGGMVPHFADAVVMFEDTEMLDEETLLVQKPCAPGANIVFVGDDIKEGAKLIEAGTRLKPQHIGTLSALGHTKVKVYKKVKVAVISTGNEIVSPEKEIALGEMRDVNSGIISALCENYGCECSSLGIVNDDFEKLKNVAIESLEGLESCDILLISGGSSVGEKDVSAAVVELLSGGVLVHGIAVKPGKPTILASVDKKAVFVLPGHPVAAYFMFEIFVSKIIHNLSGAKHLIHKNTVTATTTQNIPASAGRETYTPVKVEFRENENFATPIPMKSGLINCLNEASGYIITDRLSEGIESGAKILVHLF